jgi:hypothetical protein
MFTRLYRYNNDDEGTSRAQFDAAYQYHDRELTNDKNGSCITFQENEQYLENILSMIRELVLGVDAQ